MSLVYNPYVFETQHNPYPVYARLRDEAPVYYNPDLDFWALSRYADVLAAHKDPATFVNSHGVTLEGNEAGPGPAHHQGPAAPRLAPQGGEPGVHPASGQRPRAVHAGLQCARLLDPYVGEPGFDVVEQFSIQLPLAVIGELLGIPESLRQEVHHLADRMFTREDTATVSDDAANAQIELGMLLYGIVVDRRQDLRDDVISLLIASEVTDDDGNGWHLTDEELATRVLELAFAGHETVARLVANGVVALAWYPDQRAELVADRSLLPDAVEEMLRWDAPSHYQGRWTTTDVTLHDTTIPADSRVVLITGAANHDERVYEEPGLFDLHREIDTTVSFGYGVHFCLGASLARLETRIAFDEFLNRFPEYGIDESGVERMRSSNVRGLAKLPVTLP